MGLHEAWRTALCDLGAAAAARAAHPAASWDGAVLSSYQAILVLVGYHPGPQEVARLSACLAALPADIGYVVVSNDHRAGEAIEMLRSGAIAFHANAHNPGYGRAVNQAVAALAASGPLPPYLAALNTDLAWQEGSFEHLLSWLQEHPDVVLAVPRLVDPQGVVQWLCKPDPTLLGLFSRRFIPERLKPEWIRRYDRWYVMADQDYDQVFDVPYLSGCCMIFSSAAFQAVGGFDERFFLYLEDADLSRALRSRGRTIHLPVASVVHHWGRGNHRSRRLTLVNFHSAWIYFNKWGWRFW